MKGVNDNGQIYWNDFNESHNFSYDYNFFLRLKI